MPCITTSPTRQSYSRQSSSKWKARWPPEWGRPSRPRGNPIRSRSCGFARAFWLDACADPEVQRIVLLEALAVLGWERWSDIGHRYNIGFVTALLTDAIESGSIPRQPVEATALTVMGALREATLYIARADIIAKHARTPAR